MRVSGQIFIQRFNGKPEGKTNFEDQDTRVYQGDNIRMDLEKIE
jgi:hypothetical protein